MRAIKEVHLHHTATNYKSHDNIDIIRKWHKEKGWSDIGYTYFIDSRGGLHLGRPIEKAPASIKGRNNYAIAIALSGSFKEKNLLPSEEQVETIVNLLKNLMAIFDLEVSDIYGHRELAITICPGFNAKMIRNLL